MKKKSRKEKLDEIFGKKDTVDLSTKSIIVFDRGPFLPVALRLMRDYGQVYYYLAEEETYPSYFLDKIGAGYKGLKLIDNFEQMLDKTDMVVFTGVYNGGLPEWLKSKGYNVYSALKSEVLEMDRKKLYKALSLAKLPFPTFRGKPVWEEGYIKGMDAAQKALKNEVNKFIKTAYYRADMETKHYTNAFLSEPWFDETKNSLGIGHEGFEVIVEDAIESECEAGWDTPMLNGDIPKNIMIGYEAKDLLYAARIIKTLPDIMQDIQNKMKPAFNLYGYQAWYSNELRIDKEGKAHVIDITCRKGSPPSELYQEQYTNFSRIVWDLGHGVMPTPEYEDEYGVFIALWNTVGEKHWIPIQFPEEIDQFVKLKNSMKVDDGYYILPKDKDGDIGGVIATGKTLEEAKELAFERLDMIECDDMEHGTEADFESIMHSIECGEKFGIKFGEDNEQKAIT